MNTFSSLSKVPRYLSNKGNEWKATGGSYSTLTTQYLTNPVEWPQDLCDQVRNPAMETPILQRAFLGFPFGGPDLAPNNI